MKTQKIVLNLFFFWIFASCKTNNEILISQKYVDSLLAINTLSKHEKAIGADLIFWKNKLEKDPESIAFAQQYAALLLANFQIYRDIKDLKLAEKLLLNSNKFTNGLESGIWRSLAVFANTQHQFKLANEYAKKASQIGDNQYLSQLLLFDCAFELGKIDHAKIILTKIKKKYEYAYYFRLAKIQHYEGELLAAEKSMEIAMNLSNGAVFLQQKALSNLADLQLHSGDYEAATLNFQKSLNLDHADFHSLKGLGIIAQKHDKNYKLANKIFNYIAQKTKSPDIYYNLVQLAQATGNNKLEIEYAQHFATEANNKRFGNMYNKYLIELFEGTLNRPKYVLAVAEREINNRNTAQSNSWYCWALYQNNQAEKARDIYNKKVKERPLEGLELYFLSKMMVAEKRTDLAKAYYLATYKNRFELMPNQIKFIEKSLNN